MMRIRSFATFGCFAAAAAVLVGHAACTSSDNNNNNNNTGPQTGGNDSGAGGNDSSVADVVSNDSPVTPSTITIGVSNSLSGNLAAIGAPLHKAWTVAQNYINSNGGILGKNVNFVEMDDATDDVTQADDGGVVIGVAQKLLALHPAAIIGPNGSAQVDSVWQMFQAAHVVELSGTATSVEFSSLPNDAGPSDRFFFRTVPADDAQGKALALVAQLGPAGLGADAGVPDSGAGDAGSNACQKMALVYYANAYGIPMSNVVKANIPGSTVVVDDQIQEGQSSYDQQVKDVFAAKPDCLAMILYDTDGYALVAALQAKYGGPTPFPVYGTDGVYDQAYITGSATNNNPAPNTIVNNTFGTNPDSNPVDPVNGPNYQFFKNLYTTAFPLPQGQTDVDAFASEEFDAAMLAALAVEKAGTPDDGVKIRDSLVAITSGQGHVHGPGDFTGAVQDILNGLPITYHGASGPCHLDPNTGNTSAGYIVWQVVNGNFVTLKHLQPQ
jgi:branched-chain amino acid transport system substrate-binding protein